MFKRISRKEVYKDKWLTFYQDEIEFPNGERSTYALTDRKDGVGIAVVTTDKRILLNKEYRYVIDTYSWEIPGGGIDEGETEEEAAKRELYEETGIQVNKIERLNLFYPLNSFNSESVTVFFTVIEPTSITTAKTETDEQVSEQRYVTFTNALDMIDRGEINDAMTANVIQIIVRKFRSSSPSL